jgi:hypothetical protein
MQGNHGLLVILGRGCADIDERLLAFQMKIVLRAPIVAVTGAHLI